MAGRAGLAGCAATAILLASGTAWAAASGLYDFNRFLNEPHPFAGPVYAPAPAYAPFAAPQPAYPPAYLTPPTPGYPYPYPMQGATPETQPPPGYPTLSAPVPALPPLPQPAYQPPPAPVAPAPPPMRYTPPHSGALPPAAPQVFAAQGEVVPQRALEPYESGSGSGGWFDRAYVAGHLGAHSAKYRSETAAGVTVTVDQQDAIAGSLAFGTYIDRDFRAEIELGLRSAELDQASAAGATQQLSGTASLFTALVNGYYDFYFGSPFVPYVGLGLGVAASQSDDVTVGAVTANPEDVTTFAYQAIVGGSWDLNDRFAVSLDYRYLGTAEDDLAAHTLMLGARLGL